MTGLIEVVGNDPRVSSVAIAEHSDNEHKSVLQLIRTYLADFEDFGGVAFEMRPFKTAGGTQSREVALLNEDQAALLLTYMRNSEVVRSFKKRLVREFAELKRAPSFAVPTTLSGALRLAAEQAELIEQQQAQIEAAKPALAFVDRFVEAKSSKCLSDVAKVLGWKPMAFIAQLAKDEVIFKRSGSWVPFQHHVDVGRFTVKTGVQNEHNYVQCRVEPKGIEWLASRYGQPSTAKTA